MRRMVSKGQDVYRVVVVVQVKEKNPHYVPGVGGERYWALTNETQELEYGPYNSLGAAKGVLTRETVDTWDSGALKWGVVGGRVEKANTVWEKVNLSG